jgi:hypothetical protein
MPPATGPAIQALLLLLLLLLEAELEPVDVLSPELDPFVFVGTLPTLRA